MAKRLARVNTKICVACGECQNVCPKGAARVFKGKYARVEEALCIGCGLCAKNCPAGCIELGERNHEEKVV